MERRTNTRTFGRLAIGGVAFAIIVAVALAAFTWPAARLEPRDLPVGVVARAPDAAALGQRLSERGDAFEVHRYADEADARAAIEARDVYGALVVSGGETTLLTASAASPVVAELLEDAFASRSPVHVIDVVPADPEDPRGVALNSLLLPVTLVSVIVGAICVAVARSGFVRAAALVTASLVAGLVAVGVVQGWLGVVPGEWWMNGGAIALLVLAIGAPVAGLMALLGRRGLPLAAAVLVFCGNPWSGIATAPELLPGWVGFTGQLLPPGAGGSLLRAAAFFDGGYGPPLTVLLAWAVLGLAALWAATLRTRHLTLEGGSHDRHVHSDGQSRAPACV